MNSFEEIKTLWQSQNEKIEQQMQLNINMIALFNQNKIESNLKRFRRGPVTALIMGIIAVFTLGSFMVDVFGQWSLFSFAGLIYLYAILQVIFSVYQLSYLKKLNMEDAVLDNQRKVITLLKNRTHFLIITRFAYGVLWLPVPLIMLSMISGVNIINEVNQLWLLINMGIIIFIMIFSIYLSYNSYKNTLTHPWLLKIVSSISETDIMGSNLINVSKIMSDMIEFEK